VQTNTSGERKPAVSLTAESQDMQIGVTSGRARVLTRVLHTFKETEALNWEMVLMALVWKVIPPDGSKARWQQGPMAARPNGSKAQWQQGPMAARRVRPKLAFAPRRQSPFMLGLHATCCAVRL
jgi:hypothetical protein